MTFARQIACNSHRAPLVYQKCVWWLDLSSSGALALLPALIMDVVAQRRGLVQQMRRVALRHEVEAVRDNANRFAVETMMQKVLALPELAAQDKDVVLEAWQEYRASFPQGSFKTSGEAAETVPGFHRLLLHVRAAWTPWKIICLFATPVPGV